MFKMGVNKLLCGLTKVLYDWDNISRSEIGTLSKYLCEGYNMIDHANEVYNLFVPSFKEAGRIDTDKLKA